MSSAESQPGTLATPMGASLEAQFETAAPVRPIGEFQSPFQDVGMVPVEGGYNFAVDVDSETVHGLQLCIHDNDDPFRIVKRLEITEARNIVRPRSSEEDSTHALGGFLPSYDTETGTSIGPGTRYSLRLTDSEWSRSDGIPTEEIPLEDPRARRVLHMGPNEFAPTMSGVSDYPISVIVSSEQHPWEHSRPEIARKDWNICEAHVASLTLGMKMPPERQHLQGTFAGLATPEALEYINEQGYNVITFLPVHSYVTQPHLVRQGRRNFTGYMQDNFFALHEGYAATDDPIREFREMVDTLHGAGIKVHIDVVFNHTAEGGPGDPTYSYEALNGSNIYKVDAHGNRFDDTGCGNTLDVTKPAVIREILASMRYWVEEMGVDGFRFDLAGVLAQGGYYYVSDPKTQQVLFSSPLLDAIANDPLLCQIDLVAEPWGAKGDYRLDGFRRTRDGMWAAWNDGYREGAQSWVTGAPDKQVLSRIMTGSGDPWTSINYITSHDGQTLRDIVGGDIPAQRLAQAVLAFSQGPIMRQAGSEGGFTQYGDHDAYSCAVDQRVPYELPWGEISNSDSPYAELYEFTAALHAIRNRHPVFRQGQTPRGEVINVFQVNEGNVRFGTEVGGVPHPLEERPVAWVGPWGHRHTVRDWNDTDQFLGMHLSGLPVEDDSFIVFMNGNNWPVRAVLGSDAHESARGVYEVMIDTSSGVVAEEGHGEITEEAIVVAPKSLMVLRQIAQRLPKNHPALRDDVRSGNLNLSSAVA